MMCLFVVVVFWHVAASLWLARKNSICTISINRFCKNARVAAVSILAIFGQSKSLPVDS